MNVKVYDPFVDKEIIENLEEEKLKILMKDCKM